MSILVFVGPDRVLPGPVPTPVGGHDEPSRDAMTVETALRLRDGGVGGSVTVAALATDGADSRLRSAIASGADGGLCLEPPATGTTTVSLAATVRAAAADLDSRLVVVRNRTSSLRSCLLASAVGELSGWAAITGVVAVEAASPDRVAVHRKVGDEIEQLTCPTPAVLGVERGPSPRYPTWPDRRRAMRAEIRSRPSSEPTTHTVPVSGPEIEAICPPKPLRKPTSDPSAGELRAMAVVMGVTGGDGARSVAVLDGDPVSIATELARACRRALDRP